MRTPLQPNVEQQSPPVDQAEMFTVRFDTLEDDDDTEYAHDDDTELDHDDETAADSELDPDTEYADYTDYAETEPGPYTSSFELTEDGRWVDHNLEAPEGEELESNELLTHDPEKFELVTSLQDGESIDFESYGEDLNGRPVIFRTVYARVGSRIEVSFPEPEPYNPADLEIDEFGADDDMFAFPDAVPTTALPDLSELYNPATAEVGPAPAFEPALDLTWAALAELAASGGPTAPPAATTPQPNAAEIPEPTPWLPDLPTDAPTEMVTVIAKPKATSLFDTGEGWNVFDADPATPQPEPSPKPAPETVPSIEPVSATAELPANEPSIVPELSGVLEPASVPSPESASGPIILNASQTAQIRPLVPVPAPSTEPSTELSIGPRASAATAPTERPGGGGGGGGRAVAEPAVTKPAEPKATESTPAKPESTLAEPKSTPAESRSADTAVTAASKPAEAAPATALTVETRATQASETRATQISETQATEAPTTTAPTTTAPTATVRAAAEPQLRRLADAGLRTVVEASPRAAIKARQPEVATHEPVTHEPNAVTQAARPEARPAAAIRASKPHINQSTTHQVEPTTTFTSAPVLELDTDWRAEFVATTPQAETRMHARTEPQRVGPQHIEPQLVTHAETYTDTHAETHIEVQPIIRAEAQPVTHVTRTRQVTPQLTLRAAEPAPRVVGPAIRSAKPAIHTTEPNPTAGYRSSPSGPNRAETLTRTPTHPAPTANDDDTDLAIQLDVPAQSQRRQRSPRHHEVTTA